MQTYNVEFLRHGWDNSSSATFCAKNYQIFVLFLQIKTRSNLPQLGINFGLDSKRKTNK